MNGSSVTSRFNGELSRDNAIRGKLARRLDVWWRIREVIHTLVKTGMGGSFDKGAGQIIVVKYLQSS